MVISEIGADLFVVVVTVTGAGSGTGRSVVGGRGWEEEMNGDSPLTSPTHRPPPSTLTTLPQILSALSSLQSEEAELSNSLSALLADQEPILDSLARLQTLLPRIDELHADASTLSHKVSATARTAERVGGRVRTLDEEMRRVREASDRVQQVIELKVRLVLPPKNSNPLTRFLY